MCLPSQTTLFCSCGKSFFAKFAKRQQKNTNFQFICFGNIYPPCYLTIFSHITIENLFLLVYFLDYEEVKENKQILWEIWHKQIEFSNFLLLKQKKFK
uniref:Uncharacterized protein n=1 Tax=Octopus bimaculoides TaxID=37653 RepID=A0A0L8G9E6_OCTBM